MTDLVHSIGTSASGRKRSATAGGDKKEMSKGPWTEEEDRKVVELVGKYGPKKWSQIAQELPGAGELDCVQCVCVRVYLCAAVIMITHITHSI